MDLRERIREDQFCFLHDEREMVLEGPLGRWLVEMGYVILALGTEVWAGAMDLESQLEAGDQDHGTE